VIDVLGKALRADGDGVLDLSRGALEVADAVRLPATISFRMSTSALK
jgi:hypothetical protein